MKRLLLFLTIFGASFLILKAQTITWTGAGNGINWNDPNNWDLTTIPASSHDVIIPDGSTLTLNVDASIKSIEVQGTSTLSITNNLIFTDESSFGMNSIVNWSLGILRSGDTGPNAHISILTNRGTINAFDSGIYLGGIGLSYCKLINEGTINISDRFTLYIDGELNNEISGIIFMEEGSYIHHQIGVPGYFNAGLLNNSGIIKITNGNGIVGIYVPINNFGIIEVLSGILSFGFTGLNNSIEGIIKGTATINLPGSYFTNAGAFSPGASPGTLTVIGDFTSSPSSKLVIEINGMDQGVDCDLLTIQGDAIFDGVLDITMGFAGNINDEFIVVTTTGIITECSLASTATSIFEEIQYNFDVACRNDNEVVLTIVDKALGVDTNELWNANISLFPNPTSHMIILRNESEYKLRSALIIDIGGRILKSLDLNEMGRDKSISLRNYAIGHYFVKINSEGGSIVKRFIKL